MSFRSGVHVLAVSCWCGCHTATNAFLIDHLRSTIDWSENEKTHAHTPKMKIFRGGSPVVVFLSIAQVFKTKKEEDFSVCPKPAEEEVC